MSPFFTEVPTKSAISGNVLILLSNCSAREKILTYDSVRLATIVMAILAFALVENQALAVDAITL